MEETLKFHFQAVDNVSETLAKMESHLEKTEEHLRKTEQAQNKLNAATNNAGPAHKTLGDELRYEVEALELVNKATVDNIQIVEGAVSASQKITAAWRDFNGVAAGSAASLVTVGVAVLNFLDPYLLLEAGIKRGGKLLAKLPAAWRLFWEILDKIDAAINRVVTTIFRLGTAFDKNMRSLGFASKVTVQYGKDIVQVGRGFIYARIAAIGLIQGLAKIGQGLKTAVFWSVKFLVRGALWSVAISAAAKLAREYAKLVKAGIQLNRQTQYSEASLEAITGSANLAASSIDAISDAVRAGGPFGRPEYLEATKALGRFGLEAFLTEEGLLSFAGASIKSGESMEIVAEGVGRVVNALELAADGSDESRRVVVQSIQPMVEMGIVSRETAIAITGLVGSAAAGAKGLELLEADLSGHIDAVHIVGDTYIGVQDRITASWDELASKLAAPFDGLNALWQKTKLLMLNSTLVMMDGIGDLVNKAGELINPYAQIVTQTAEIRRESLAMAPAVVSSFNAADGAISAVVLSAEELSDIYEELDDNTGALTLKMELLNQPTAESIEEFSQLRSVWDSLDPVEQARSMERYAEKLSKARDAGHELTFQEQNLADAFDKTFQSGQAVDEMLSELVEEIEEFDLRATRVARSLLPEMALRFEDLVPAIETPALAFGFFADEAEMMAADTQKSMESVIGSVMEIPPAAEEVRRQLAVTAPTWGQSLLSGLKSTFSAENMTATLASAFEGGGGLMGGLKSLGAQAGGVIMGKIQGALSAAGPWGQAAAAALPLAMAFGKKIWSGIKRMFGGPSEAVVAARDSMVAFAETIEADSVNQKRLQEWVSGGFRADHAKIVTHFQDIAEAAGESAQAGVNLWLRYQRAVENGNQAAIDSVMAQAEAWGLTSEAAEEAAAAAEAYADELAVIKAELLGIPTEQTVADFDALRQVWNSLDPVERAAGMNNYVDALIDAAEAGVELTEVEQGLVDAWSAYQSAMEAAVDRQDSEMSALLTRQQAEMAGIDAQIDAVSQRLSPKISELDALLAEQTAELNALKARQQSELDALAQGRAAALSAMTASHATAMAGIDSQLNALEQRLNPKISELDALLAQQATELGALKTQQQSELDALAQSRATALSAMTASHDAAMSALRSRQQAEMGVLTSQIDRLKALLDTSVSEVDALLSQQQAELDALKAQQQGELDALAQSRAAALSAMTASHNAAMSALRARQAAEMGTLTSQIGQLKSLLNTSMSEVDSLLAQQKSELDALSERQETEISVIRTRRSEALEMIQATQRKQLSYLRDEQRAALDELKASQAAELGALKAARSAALGVVEAAIARELEDERIRAQLSIDIRKAGSNQEALHAANARANEAFSRLAERDELNDLMKEAEERVRARYQSELNSINQHWDNKEDAVAARHRGELAAMGAQHDLELSTLEASHAAELTAHNSHWDALETETTTRHEAEIAALEAHHVTQQEALLADLEERRQTLETGHATELSTLEASQSAELESHNTYWDTLEAETATRHEAEIAVLEAHHINQQAALLASLEERRQALETSHTTELSALEIAQAAELAAHNTYWDTLEIETAARHEAETAALEAHHTTQLEELRADLLERRGVLEAAHALELAAHNVYWDTLEAETAARHEAELETLDTRHTTQLEELRADLLERRGVLEAAHALELSDVEAKHAAELASIEAHWEEAKLAVQNGVAAINSIPQPEPKVITVSTRYVTDRESPDIPDFGGERAMGGPVNAGMSYLVGERGPELFVPQQGGYINPNIGGGPIIIQIDGREIGRANVEHTPRAARRRGF